MKTNRILFLFAVAAMLCSCAKELATPEVQGRGEGTLTLSVNLDENVRTALGEKDGTTYPLTWSEGDCLVLDGVASNALTAAYSGKKNADFSFAGDFKAPYNLVYGGVAGKADVVKFQQVQPYVAGTFAPFTAPMYGTGSSLDGIVMKPLAAAVRIPLTGEGKITKVIVEAVGGETLSGEFTLAKTGDALSGGMTAVQGGSATTSVDCGEGVALSGTEVSFFASIPAGNYAKGLKVYAINADKKAMVLTISNLTNAVAGKVYSLPAKAFAAGDTYVIATAEDMDVLPTLIDETGVGKTVILVNDIDMSGREWVSFGSGGTVTNPGNFTATLDGMGYTISGLKTPLFGNLAGIVKNLTLDVNLDYTNDSGATYKGSTYGFGAIAGYASDDTNYTKGKVTIDRVTVKGSVKVTRNVGNNYNVGGLVGANNGATLINCINEADITMNGTLTSGNLTIGGICGASQSTNPTFHSNVNKGDIAVNGAVNAGYVYGGGVVGSMSANTESTVQNLENYGTITVAKTCTVKAATYFGGVLGYYNVASNIKDWKNEGDIHFACNSKDNIGIYFGGVLGRINKAISKCENLTNRGKLYVEDGFAFGYCAIGGVISHIKATVACSNLVNEGDFEAKVRIKTTGSSFARMGGVVGHIEGIAGTVSLSNSTNSGNFTFNNAGGASTMVVGGIVGNAKANVFNATNNTNSGDITVNGTPASECNYSGCYARIETNANPTTVTITGTEGVATNSGRISLYDDGALSVKPCAGGIVGTIFGSSTNAMKFDITDCTNAGQIYRKVSNYTYNADDYKAETKYHQAGGVVGNIATYISGTMLNCTNTASVQFDKNPQTGKPLGNASQGAGYTGGIVGRISADNTYTVKCCRNTGDIPVIEGYAGGIAGYVWKGNIVGEKGNYTTNTGNVVYSGDPAIRPQTTSGGIVGGGSTLVQIKWCYNTGATAGNGAAAGIIGQINNIDALMTIQNCKSYAVNCCTSAWAKGGLIFATSKGQTSAAKVLTNMSHIAVGGQICYGATKVEDLITPTAENYNKYLYYNSTTAPADAQASMAAPEVLDVATLQETYDITLWDGTSTPAWEN